MTKSRMSLAAIVLGATIIGTGAAFAQTPAPPTTPAGKASVEIKDAAAKDAGAKPAAAAPTATGAGKTKEGTSRDPFVEASRSAAPVHRKGDKEVVVAPGAKKPGEKAAKAPEPVIAPPPVTVHGIVESPRGNLAILVGPSQTWIVKSGDKLGDYHVTKIGKRTVAFSFQDKTFKLPLEADPLSGVSKKSGGGPKPPAPKK